MNKIRHRLWSAFFAYLYILDLINARKMQHIEMTPCVFRPIMLPSSNRQNTNDEYTKGEMIQYQNCLRFVGTVIV